MTLVIVDSYPAAAAGDVSTALAGTRGVRPGTRTPHRHRHHERTGQSPAGGGAAQECNQGKNNALQ